MFLIFVAGIVSATLLSYKSFVDNNNDENGFLQTNSKDTIVSLVYHYWRVKFSKVPRLSVEGDLVVPFEVETRV